MNALADYRIDLHHQIAAALRLDTDDIASCLDEPHADQCVPAVITLELLVRAPGLPQLTMLAWEQDNGWCYTNAPNPAECVNYPNAPQRRTGIWRRLDLPVLATARHVAATVAALRDGPTAEHGEYLTQRLLQAAEELLTPIRIEAGKLRRWSSPDWLVLRALTTSEASTALFLAGRLHNRDRTCDSDDVIAASLARHAREVANRWPAQGNVVESTLKAAHRGGLVGCDWRNRGPSWLWWITDTGRAVISRATTPP